MKKKILALILICMIFHTVSANDINKLEFINRDLTDILVVLASIGNVTILPDETVTGRATFYFEASDFGTAFNTILSANNLYAERTGDVIRVSKIQVSEGFEDNTFSLHADDTPIRSIIRKLMRDSGYTILFDNLPNDTISIHLDDKTIPEIVEVLIRRFPSYTLKEEDGYVYIERVQTQSGDTGGVSVRGISKSADLYTANLDRTRFVDFINTMFEKEGKEFVYLDQIDGIISNFKVSDRTFEDMLKLGMLQVGADFTVQNNIYYISQAERRELKKEFETVVRLPLQFLNPDDIPRLLPQAFASNSLYRLDARSGGLIISGSPSEIEPLVEFIKTIDRPVEGKEYFRFDLSYLDAKNIAQVLPQEYSGIQFVQLPDENSVVALLSASKASGLQEYLNNVDSEPEYYPIELRYITLEDLKKVLPSYIKEDQIIAGSGDAVFQLKGTQSLYRSFLRDLELIDQPQKQIRYQLLVVQNTGSNDVNFENSVSFSQAESASPGVVAVGNLDKLLSLDFDILNLFGYRFAVDLQASIGASRATVLADTSLASLSGGKVSFRNTETSRFQSGGETDPDTGKVITAGVTKEISSGLIIDIEGWVSGSGMITMNVSTTISKQIADSSGDSNLPSTSEKIINTDIRTQAGVPVVIGGLIQKDENTSVNKVPILGDIPLLGLLFRKEVTSISVTEMTIYIIPRIDVDLDSEADKNDLYIERIFESLVAGR
jgi:general secretion pathway protein D